MKVLQKSIAKSMFQFLMVRLKVGLHQLRKPTKTQFQFLMVRLKVSRDYGSDRSSIVSIPYGTIKSFGRSG